MRQAYKAAEWALVSGLFTKLKSATQQWSTGGKEDEDSHSVERLGFACYACLLAYLVRYLKIDRSIFLIGIIGLSYFTLPALCRLSGGQMLEAPNPHPLCQIQAFY